MLVILNGVDPGLPATADFGIRPPSVGFQDPTQSNEPGGELDIDE